MRTRALATAAAGVLLALAALAGCAAEPAPRTTPNAVELEALAQAGGFFGAARTGADAGTGQWVQLWTPKQAGPVIKACVNRLSAGFVDAMVQIDSQGGIGLSFTYGRGGAGTAGVSESEQQKSVQDVIDRCIGSTPIDTRVSHLPISAWGALYSYDATALRRCLMARGQKVGRIPDRALFESLLRAGVPWSPYDHVVVAKRSEWYTLSDACPAFPPEITAG